MLDLSIIIVSYNAKEYLKECIDSIIENVSKKIEYEIIVIDNASTDNTIKEVKTKKNIRLIENKENLGFSRANNIGVKEARGRYLLFLNPDTIIYPYVLEEMVAFMDFHKEAGAATCRLLMENGEMDYACHRGFPTPWNSFCYFSGLGKILKQVSLFNGYTLNNKNKQNIHEVDAISGAFMFIRHKAGEEIGWWDEDYFFNGEDIDFCYELKQKGWKIYYIPYYLVLHYNGISGGTKKSTQNITTADITTKRFVTKMRFDAMKIFYKKHYYNKYPKLISFLVIGGIDLLENIVIRKIH